MFYNLGPREKDSTPNKKKNTPSAPFFFAPRAARAHSLTLLFVEMFYRLCPREKDSTPNKKKHVQCAFFFCSPRGPGSLTHLFRSSNIINVGNRKRNARVARGTKKNRKWHAYGAKKKCVFRFKGSGHINVLETRAYTTWVKWCASRNPNSRILGLIDSRVLLGAAAKGRSSSPAISRVLRSSLPYLLGGGLYPGGLRVYSAKKRIDGPSSGRSVDPPTKE